MSLCAEVQTPAFKQYVMRRNGQATRSAKTIEMQAMEQRLQRMLRRPRSVRQQAAIVLHRLAGRVERCARGRNEGQDDG